MHRAPTPEEMMFLLATGPSGIESLEQRGAMRQEKLETLPREMNKETREALLAFGFQFEDEGQDKKDSLFVPVKFPPGWTKRRVPGNSYWTNLVSPNGHTVFEIFYKAAFYDMQASIRFIKRYSVQGMYDEDYRTIGFKLVDNKDETVLYTIDYKGNGYDTAAGVANQKIQDWCDANNIPLNGGAEAWRPVL